MHLSPWLFRLKSWRLSPIHIYLYIQAGTVKSRTTFASDINAEMVAIANQKINLDVVTNAPAPKDTMAKTVRLKSMNVSTIRVQTGRNVSTSQTILNVFAPPALSERHVKLVSFRIYNYDWLNSRKKHSLPKVVYSSNNGGNRPSSMSILSLHCPPFKCLFKFHR